MKYYVLTGPVLALFLLMITGVQAQTPTENLQLPALGISDDSQTGWDHWEAKRSKEIMSLFEREVYGAIPDEAISIRFTVDSKNKKALNGRATSKSVTVTLQGNGNRHDFNLFLYLPNKGKGPYPIFLGLNFYGNHTVHPDPDIPISKSWTPNNPQFCVFNHQADAVSRGVRSWRWPVERLIERGYGLAVVYSGDIDPDFDDGFANGVHRLFKTERDDYAWGTISAWAWGLSRAMDYLIQDKDVDADRVAVMGHSRLGKAALWAGARDDRFALVISNDSGCGGAALSRRKSGERLADINANFPHWFCDKFTEYNGREEALPIDQHLLMALVAPRPLYVASAEQDDWADPYGEYLSLYHAAPAYRLSGQKAELPVAPPEVNQPRISGPLGYHIRSGRHDVTRYDWERFMDFADRQFSSIEH